MKSLIEQITDIKSNVISPEVENQIEMDIDKKETRKVWEERAFYIGVGVAVLAGLSYLTNIYLNYHRIKKVSK